MCAPDIFVDERPCFILSRTTETMKVALEFVFFRFGKLAIVRIPRQETAASLGFRIVGGVGSHQGDLPIVIKSISSRSLASRYLKVFYIQPHVS